MSLSDSENTKCRKSEKKMKISSRSSLTAQNPQMSAAELFDTALEAMGLANATMPPQVDAVMQGAVAPLEAAGTILIWMPKVPHFFFFLCKRCDPMFRALLFWCLFGWPSRPAAVEGWYSIGGECPWPIQRCVR